MATIVGADNKVVILHSPYTITRKETSRTVNGKTYRYVYGSVRVYKDILFDKQFIGEQLILGGQLLETKKHGRNAERKTEPGTTEPANEERSSPSDIRKYSTGQLQRGSLR